MLDTGSTRLNWHDLKGWTDIQQPQEMYKHQCDACYDVENKPESVMGVVKEYLCDF